MEYVPEPPEEIAEHLKRANERDRSANVLLMALEETIEFDESLVSASTDGNFFQSAF